MGGRFSLSLSDDLVLSVSLKVSKLEHAEVEVNFGRRLVLSLCVLYQVKVKRVSFDFFWGSWNDSKLLFLFVSISLMIIMSNCRPASLIGNVIVEWVPSQALLD